MTSTLRTSRQWAETWRGTNHGRTFASAIGLGIAFAVLAGCDAETTTPAGADAPSNAAVESATGTPRPAVEEASEEPAEVAEDESETFVMPDLVGMVLQDAQDLLQSVGSYFMDQEDATGLDRMQLNDSNWSVCSQQPAAGTEVPVETIVILHSAKLDETCPAAAGDRPSVDGTDDADDSDEGDEPEAPADSDEPELTVAQQQAVRKALSYLDYTSFSKSGLVDQLKFEGFSSDDARFAVDHIDVNWKEQAALKAESYLEYSAFSRSGLIDQLIFEGFTRKQAEYGATSVGL